MVLFFQRGAFTASDAVSAGALFGLLVLNGPAAAAVSSLARAFYAVQETRIPVLLDVLGNLLVLVFVPVLAARFGGPGAVFAYMLVPWVTACGLIIFFKRRFGSLSLIELGGFAVLILLVSALSAWVGSVVGQSAGHLPENRVLAAALTVLAAGVVAAAAYCCTTLLLRLPEASVCSTFLHRALHFPFRPGLSEVSASRVLGSGQVGTVERP
jgi:putative peptidoglycan lipid II flippase